MPSIIRLLAIIALAITIWPLHASDKKQKTDFKYDLMPTSISSCNSHSVTDCCFSHKRNDLVFIRTSDDLEKRDIIFHDIKSDSIERIVPVARESYVFDLNHDDSLLATTVQRNSYKQIDIWDTQTKERKLQLDLSGYLSTGSVKFNPSGTAIAACDSTVKVYDITAGKKQIRNFNPGGIFDLRDVVWSSDTSVLSITDKNTVHVWDTRNNSSKPTSTIQASTNESTALGNQLVLTPDTRTLIASCSKRIAILDLRSKEILGSIPAREKDYFISLALVSDDNPYIVATTCRYQTLLKYDLKTQKQCGSPNESAYKERWNEGLFKVTYSPINKCFATISCFFNKDLPAIALWRQKLPMTIPSS